MADWNFTNHRTVHRKLGELGLDYERAIALELANENAKDRHYWRQRHTQACAEISERDDRGELAVHLWHTAERRARRWRWVAILGWTAILAGLIWAL